MPRDIQVKLPQDTPSRGDPTVTEHPKKGRDAANDILSHPLSGDSDAAGLRQDRKGNHHCGLGTTDLQSKKHKTWKMRPASSFFLSYRLTFLKNLFIFFNF